MLGKILEVLGWTVEEEAGNTAILKAPDGKFYAYIHGLNLDGEPAFVIVDKFPTSSGWAESDMPIKIRDIIRC